MAMIRKLYRQRTKSITMWGANKIHMIINKGPKEKTM